VTATAGRGVAPLAFLLLAAALGAQTPADTARPRPFDVLDYDLAVDLPDSGPVIEMSAVLVVRRRAPADTLWLDLRALRVHEVHAQGRTTAFARTPERVGIPLPPFAGREDTMRVSLRYGGAVTDGLVAQRDPRGRWTHFGDNWPDRARHWIASVDHPGDKATVSWTVRAPSTHTVVANGALVERRPLEPRAGTTPRTVTRWREERPIPVYLMVIGAAPLVEHPLGEGACGLAELTRCVAQSVYAFPEQARTIPAAFQAAPRIVEHFARLVGPFPYEKLAHVQSATRFGGMENASAIFYAGTAFVQQTLGESLIAHETAHQWFGDAVTEREWPHLWLSEGFATYFALLWTEHAHGAAAFREERAALRRQILEDRASVPERPVIDTVETDLLRLLNANSYQKGGFVLHMLRRQVGDSAFFRGIRAYYAAHRHGNATSDDLRAALERSSGTDLRWYFDQWLRRPGHPQLAVRWSYDSTARRLVLDVRQERRFGFFRLPLVVAIEGGGTGAPVTARATVEVPAEGESRLVMPIDVEMRPTRVALDPDVDLLAELRITPR